MQKGKSHQKLIAFIVFLVIASLSAGIFISRRTAIQNAIQGCDTLHLRAEERPSTIKTQININQRTHAEPLRIAWTVDMQGKWILVGGPPPAEGQPEPAPQHFSQCTAIIDPFNGNVIEVGAR